MIKIGPQLMEYAEQLERDRGIPRDLVLSSLKEAMVAAYKRTMKLETTAGIICKLNEKSGEIGLYEQNLVVKKVVEKKQPTEEELAAMSEEELEEEKDPKEYLKQITVKDARKIKPDIEEGDILEIEVTPEEFGRIAAQSAKQVIMQRIREAEKMLVQTEFEEKRGTVTTAIVQRIEGRNVIVNIGRTEALLPPREQLPGEYYRVGNKLRAYVLDLKDIGRVPQIIVSQGHPAMVREVFELEVPEIEDGIVEIKNIAREAGHRTKVAVTSNDPEVDAQGACIGTRGSRIQAIVNELRNEKIDIIRWSENPAEFITHALAPAKIARVELDEEGPQRRAIVVVPDDQLSLAIGREGQNVRLAAKLTGWKLDIKSLSSFEIPAEPAEEEASAETLTEEPTEAEVLYTKAATEEAELAAAEDHAADETLTIISDSDDETDSEAILVTDAESEIVSAEVEADNLAEENMEHQDPEAQELDTLDVEGDVEVEKELQA